MNIKNYFALALLIGVIALSVTQINSAETSTKTEIALINILQLVFSVGFSWIISSYFSEIGFQKSQKKFAIGAFRRIKEIERSISRAQKLLTSDKNITDKRDDHEHTSVMVSLLSAQDAVNSSIADWGDIIGDEIHITKEISRLKSLRSSSDKFEKEYLDNLTKQSKKDKDIEKEINELKSELPASLRITEDDEEAIYDAANEYLLEEITNTGLISLRGFWESEDSFSADLSAINSGDTLYISRGFTKDRGDALLAYDENDNWVGVITNKFMSYDKKIMMGYDEFVDLFESIIDYNFIPKAFGGTPLPITVTNIEELNENGHQHFDAILNVKDIPNNA